MQEIQAFLNSVGLHPKFDDCVPDGKWKRFAVSDTDKKKSGAFKAYQNSTRDGRIFFVIVYENHQDGCGTQTHCTLTGKVSKEDRALIKKQIDDAIREAENARKAIQEEVANQCEDRWNATQDLAGPSKYLSAKGLTEGRFGAKLFIENPIFSTTALLVPMRDIGGKLWSLQTIKDDFKGFEKGGKTKGCFHQIGELTEDQPIRICEGFATGITIHLATNECVFVAFQAGNLLDVSKDLKKKYINRPFIIHGDDDLWTKKANGEMNNTGRIAAEEAAKAVMGLAVFPKFKNLIEYKSDFDDLRQLEGLDVVKEQLCGENAPIPESHYIIPLGYNENDYFFISNINPQVQKFSASQLATNNICRLQPLLYWESVFPSQKESVSWTAAADHLMQQCHEIGIFRPDKIRGRGVWIDNNEIVYHMGDRLYYKNENVPLHDIKSKYIYELAEELPPPHPEPLTVDECQLFIEAANLVRWKRPESAIFYTGWVAISAMGGALSWRPHLWITGPTGSGKSYITQEMTYPLIKNFSQYFRGQTTEAGIRQKCGRSTLPVMFDEFETNDDHSAGRIRSVLELARQASSDSDGVVAKGTVTGEAMEFKPQFCMCVGSVRMNLVHVEDENRFTVLELKAPDASGQGKQFEELQSRVIKMGEEYGERLFSRMIGLGIPLRASFKVLQDVISRKYPMRVAQQYAALMAGHWMLLSDTVISEDMAISMRDSISFDAANDSMERQDEMECLDYLLQKIIRIDEGDRSILEMIKDPIKYGTALERIGIKATSIFICIACTDRSLSEFYRGSKWASNYAKQLSRIPLVETNKAHRLLGVVRKCVMIPVTAIFQA